VPAELRVSCEQRCASCVASRLRQARRPDGAGCGAGQEGRAAELRAALAAAAAAPARLPAEVLARRFVRGVGAPSAAAAAAAIVRRRFLSGLPACAGALQLAAYEWAADELGDQARPWRTLAHPGAPWRAGAAAGSRRAGHGRAGCSPAALQFGRGCGVGACALAGRRPALALLVGGVA